MVRKGIKKILEFIRDQDAQGLTEYGLILLLVSIVSVGILTTLGQDLNSLFQQVIPLGAGS